MNGNAEQPRHAFVRARIVGAVFAVLIQGVLLSIFLIYHQEPLPTGRDMGSGGSAISVSLIGNINQTPHPKAVTARAITAPILPFSRPQSGPAGTAGGVPSADNESSTVGSLELGGSETSSAAISSFQQQLSAHIENYRRYPLEARRNHQDGLVELLFAMDRNGLVLGVWIKRSSGNALLDREAVATVLRAQPMPAIPRDLPAPLNITLPMAFSIEQ